MESDVEERKALEIMKLKRSRRYYIAGSEQETLINVRYLFWT